MQQTPEPARLAAAFLACSVLLLGIVAAPGAATPGFTDEYVAGTTLVVKQAGQKPIADDNVLTVCNKHNPDRSIGGGCIPFGPWDAVHVNDALAGDAVAYQVCIDNDGDFACTFGGERPNPCRDQIFFSHDDSGAFFNPIGPLPMGFTPGCPGGWPGYVVFLCTGVHDASGAHTHAATTGIIKPTSGASGNYGDFCGLPEVTKPYTVQ